MMTLVLDSAGLGDRNTPTPDNAFPWNTSIGWNWDLVVAVPCDHRFRCLHMYELLYINLSELCNLSVN